jgi:predicted Ser/Thr protein kinase
LKKIKKNQDLRPKIKVIYKENDKYEIDKKKILGEGLNKAVFKGKLHFNKG